MALLLQSLSADLELLPNVIWRKPQEKLFANHCYMGLAEV
jgi:hypothetical protein